MMSNPTWKIYKIKGKMIEKQKTIHILLHLKYINKENQSRQKFIDGNYHTTKKEKSIV